MFKKPISHKAAQFTESVIREMTRLAMEHGAINLSQGYPDFAAPEILKKEQESYDPASRFWRVSRAASSYR